MTEVVSIKFRNRGKCYFFDPGQLNIKSGDKVVVETSKGLEITDCCRGNHMVPETSVVQPLRPVVRIANDNDLAIDEANRKREQEAFVICRQKIAEHGLDMKLVEVECSFEGNKIMFFFTSDERVDFRELVKDLAAIFRSRIELRQIGVRDEAKMIGGIAICGRPYCCSQFLDGFQPVSTKMAKVQSLSLNPTKISGSCGRLMCCLRYEQEAYEDLLKKVPKQGAFVQTKDGYGTAVQVNLLRQTVKVKLDSDSDDTLRLYKANELATVPGGRPKDGETPPDVFKYVPEEETEEPVEDEWGEAIAALTASPETESVEVPVNAVRSGRRQRRRGKNGRPERQEKSDEVVSRTDSADAAPQTPAGSAEKQARKDRPYKSGRNRNKKRAENGSVPEKKEKSAAPAERKATAKPVKVEVKSEKSPETAKSEKSGDKSGKNRKNYRRYHHGKPRTSGNNDKEQ